MAYYECTGGEKEYNIGTISPSIWCAGNSTNSSYENTGREIIGVLSITPESYVECTGFKISGTYVILNVCNRTGSQKTTNITVKYLYK